MAADAITKIIPGAAHPEAALMKGCHVQVGVTIGARTRVWQFASVIRRAEVGEDCTIAANAIVDGCRIGNRCSIGHAASIHPGALIGDDVFIGPHVTLCNDLWPRTDKAGFDAARLLSGELVQIIIGSGASVGAHSTVLPGVTIGPGAMVAANAVVQCDVPGNHLYHRDGRIDPIDALRPANRMRTAL